MNAKCHLMLAAAMFSLSCIVAAAPGKASPVMVDMDKMNKTISDANLKLCEEDAGKTFEVAVGDSVVIV